MMTKFETDLMKPDELSSEQHNGFRHKIIGKFDKTRWVITAAIGTAIYLPAIDDNMRHIPEKPFDIFNHAGNLCLSAQAGFIAGIFASNAFSQKFEDNSTIARRKTRLIMAAAGLAVGTVVNAMAETKIGLSINPFFRDSTPDTLDFAYGTLAASIGAAAGPSLEITADDRN